MFPSQLTLTGMLRNISDMERKVDHGRRWTSILAEILHIFTFIRAHFFLRLDCFCITFPFLLTEIFQSQTVIPALRSSSLDRQCFGLCLLIYKVSLEYELSLIPKEEGTNGMEINHIFLWKSFTPSIWNSNHLAIYILHKQGEGHFQVGLGSLFVLVWG